MFQTTNQGWNCIWKRGSPVAPNVWQIHKGMNKKVRRSLNQTTQELDPKGCVQKWLDLFPQLARMINRWTKEATNAPRCLDKRFSNPPGKDWQSGNNNNNMQQLHSLMPVPWKMKCNPLLWQTLVKSCLVRHARQHSSSVASRALDAVKLHRIFGSSETPWISKRWNLAVLSQGNLNLVGLFIADGGQNRN